MPKRTDLGKILIIGPGPIVIGQACEFDYSGVQACKALQEEGYEVVLVNSNPATIMTDPDFADRTYIEPLTVDYLAEIIRRERPDAVLPTLGGQTALNLAMELEASGILARYHVEMIGARPESIRKAEDRGEFKTAMERIGLDMPRSKIAHSLEEAQAVAKEFNQWPLIIRPGFTLGGTGGGIARNEADFETIAKRGLFYSPTSEILIEESIEGWKEYEMEVMRDAKDNCVIICSIENVDPMGIHTGDSITVAPALTLTDREYQQMRDAAFAVMREIGVETGGSNVQFAINPKTGRLIVIEMNPRVSRSSALASKATGFPIAKIAAKLAVGYTLDEIRNDITRETPACFEPSIDYVVTKIPRFAFEKFPDADSSLGTQMKSVGETMSIGRTFKESFQKALRSLETGRHGFGADGNDSVFESLDEAALIKLIEVPSATRIFAVREAFKRGWSVEKVHSISKIDPWFLREFEELAAYEGDIASLKSLGNLVKDPALFRQAKTFGYSDRQIANLLSCSEDEVRNAREALDIVPSYNLVDTCAAEFEAFTPYYYSTYDGVSQPPVPKDGKRRIMILGGGPNRIGQGIEFDYCCVHASFALRAAGIETIMVNSNPETVSTDYDTSDKLYFEPLTLEDILPIYRREQCDGVIVQFGGQTPLNLAQALESNGVNIIGTQPAMIDIAEDRKQFGRLVNKLGIRQPAGATVVTEEDAIKVAQQLGYPVLIRPSFVLGGRAMVIVYDEDALKNYMRTAIEISESRPVLIDHYLGNAVEVDVDCVSDGEKVVIGGIMEHVELAGVHSGDSASTIPPPTLSKEVLEILRSHTQALALGLEVRGLMNVQYAVHGGEVYVLEVNPRASRTIPFVSKTIGVPLAKIAALVMAGWSLKDIGFTQEVETRHTAVKEAVFPFTRFPGSDILLSPEMKSTGEVMGIDMHYGLAFLKSQIAAGNKIPRSGNVFLSVRNQDKTAIVPLAKKLSDMGFILYATIGTSTLLRDNGIKAQAIFRISMGRPNVIDHIEENNLVWLINTPTTGSAPAADEVRMRSHAVIRGIPVTTTISGLEAAIAGLETIRTKPGIEVCSLQEYQRRTPHLSWPTKDIFQNNP